MADDRRQPELFEFESGDEELSALIDGELSEPKAHALRERLENDDELGERLAAMRDLQAELRQLADEPLTGEQLAVLRAGFDRRLAAQREATPLRNARVISFSALRSRPLRWIAPAAAALAAGLALYLAGVQPAPFDRAAPGSATTLGEVSTHTAMTHPAGVAAQIGVATPGGATPYGVGTHYGVTAPSEDEVAIALELDTLSDLDVIEDLDLLEALDALASPELAEGGGQI